MTWIGETSNSGVVIFSEDGTPESAVGNLNDILIFGPSKPKFVPKSDLNLITSQDLANSTKSVFVWGNNDIGNSTTVRYATPGYVDALARKDPVRFVLPATSGTFKNMVVYHNSPKGNGQNITYTFRVNGGDTALAVTMASTATSGSNLSNPVNVIRPQTIDIKITKAGNIGASPENVVISMEFI